MGIMCSQNSKVQPENESGTTTHSTSASASKRSLFTYTIAVKEAMKNRTNVTGRINVKEVETISSQNTETEHENSKTPPPRPAKTYSNHHKRTSTQQTVNPDVYDFTHPQRGYMVLIVNDRFYRTYEKRYGAEYDMFKSEEIAIKLGFRILNRNKERNLKKGEMIRVLREAQALDHSGSDCFALIISTHGLESPNPRARGKKDDALVCSDNKEVFTSTIFDMFNETQCPTLKGKPKLFFIQACRGYKLDHGAAVKVAHPVKVDDKTCEVVMGVGNINKRPRPPAQESVDELDSLPLTGSSASNVQPVSAAMKQHSPSRSQRRPLFVPKDPVLPIQSRTKYYMYVNRPINVQRVPIQQATRKTVHKIYAPQPYPIVDTPSLKCGNDFLVLYATPSGMYAWRNKSDGSWMIHYLHQVIMAYNMARQPTNLLSLLTKVSALMSKRETVTLLPKMNQKKEVSVIEHKLTKDVIFTPKVAMSDWVM